MSSLQDFSLLSRVGAGNYGEVYLSIRGPNGSFPYALKMISLRSMSDAEKSCLVRECHILNGLMHPNVVLYYDSFLDQKNSDDHLCIVMEYCNGGSLHDLIRLMKQANHFVPENVVWKWLIQTAYALKYVHHRQIVHRDIKPMNLLLSLPSALNGRSGEDLVEASHKLQANLSRLWNCDVKVADFGVSRLLSSNSMAQTLIGTPLYLSPEAINGEKYDSKVDIWALGCCMYELMERVHPFESSNAGALLKKIMDGKFNPIDNSRYSNELIDIVVRCLDQNPTNRPSCEELLRLEVIVSKAAELGIVFDESYEGIDLSIEPLHASSDTDKEPISFSVQGISSAPQTPSTPHHLNSDGRAIQGKVYSHCIPPRPVASKKANSENVSRIRRPPSQRANSSRRGLSLRSNKITGQRLKEIEKVNNLPDIVGNPSISTRGRTPSQDDGVIELHVKQPELFNLLNTESIRIPSGDDLEVEDFDDFHEQEQPTPTWKVLDSDEDEENTNEDSEAEETLKKVLELESDISSEIGEQLLQAFIQFFVENPSLSEEKVVQFAFGRISYTQAAVVPKCKELVELRSICVLRLLLERIEGDIIDAIDTQHYKEILSFFLQKKNPTEDDIHRFVFGRISYEHVDLLHLIRKAAWIHREIQIKSVLVD